MELLNCPFCGGPAIVHGTDMVVCRDTVDCGAQIDLEPLGKSDITEAKRQWNTRAPDQRIAELEAECERLRVGHERYETARLMNPQQWANAWKINVSTGKPFDEIIDHLKPFYRPAKESER